MKTDGLKLQTDGDVPELFIYDDIGPEWLGMISATMVTRVLKEVAGAKRLNVRINSLGGDVFEGLAIFNALDRFEAETIVDVDGIAASAASVIAMSGDRIRMADNSMMMIHRAWTIALGNALEMAKVVGLLHKIDDSLIDTYHQRTKTGKRKIREMLDAETWLTAKEAKSLGFADEVGPSKSASASVARGRFRNTPERFLSDAEEWTYCRGEDCRRIAASLKAGRSGADGECGCRKGKGRANHNSLRRSLQATRKKHGIR